ncbi:Uu.00g031630.m01.CDS01 [Anthostomella pinea]|uniref:Uu.00g031630.m01.CDS01 n=1 Tax=Anthostomella pinea TaxID=933095 RepID=A0AAI8YD24_9PEZI|nr:Uu.00g031630.m01.CDS01 [Anthostomella pinea]
MANDTHQEAQARATDPLKEPSFQGRLQLKDYMFTSSSKTLTSPTMRRSPRLLAHHNASAASTTTSSSSSASASPSMPAPKEATPKKRKAAPQETTSSPSSPSPKKKKRTRKSTGYAPPSTYAHLPHLPDAIGPNLLILFIGLNPGVQTARTGHAYAHPSNLFWKLLHSSGITPDGICRAQDDRLMPARFALGNTNIVARPSRSGAELSKAEMDEGVAALEDKCRRYRPECVCVVGKGIWESVWRVWKGRSLTKNEFRYGWQEERMGAVPPRPGSMVKAGAWKGGGRGRGEKVKVEGGDGDASGVKRQVYEDTDTDDSPWEGAKIFVATSTSGLAATLRPEEKERIWKILGDWCVQRRKEREDEAVKEKADP